MNDAPRDSVQYLIDKQRRWRKTHPKKKTLLSEYPEIAAQWHPTKNGDLTPDQVAYRSNQKRWWMCLEGHEWEATVSNRAKGTGCPYCAGHRAISGVNDLATKRPELVVEWHSVKNGTLRPQDVTEFSHKKVWWMCSKGHEWQANIINRIHGTGCPYCKGKYAIPGETDLAILYPELASEWNAEKNGMLTPDQVTSRSNRKVWWRCEKGHEWQTAIYDRVLKHRRCPYCTGQKPIVGENDLATVNPDLAAQWNPSKNHLKPTDVTCHSGKKAWWLCSEGHE